MNQSALLEKFRSESVATASPARLVTMLYDRMVLDVDRSIVAIKAGDRLEANSQIQHAQAIIAELQSSLDHSVWEGATQLDALYSWLTVQLITANVEQDAELAQTCRDILAPLRDAWHGAAAALADGTAAPAGAPAAGLAQQTSTTVAPRAATGSPGLPVAMAGAGPAESGMSRDLGVG